MKTTEGNKLIAEFMGIESDNAKMRGMLYECPVTAEYTNKLEYNYSWDWLMPVVEKLLEISSTHVLAYQYKKDLRDVLTTLDLDLIYECAVEFTKWYNGQQNK